MPRRDFVFLVFLALAVNFTLAAFVREPRYTDDAYYYAGALRLVEGQGFTEPYFWNYVGAPTTLPQPSHLYWMPLTSILAAVSMAIFGHSFEAARLPLVIAASLLPVPAYIFGRKIEGSRRQALCAGLFTVFCGFYASYWGTTDAFGVFGLAASAALLGIGLGGEIGRYASLMTLGTGMCAGLAHLARADGVLILMTGLAVAVWRVWQTWNAAREQWVKVTQQLGLLLAGYLLVMSPWFVRNLSITGSPLGGGGLNTIWMVEYNDLFTYPNVLTPARYLAAGWPAILYSKWDALIVNLQHIIGEQCLVFMTPFVAIGLWRLRRHQLYQPTLLYALGLYAAMTFIFTFPGPRGGLFHSGPALLPAYMAAAVAGLDATVHWIATRRRYWRADIAKRNFSGMAVALAVGLTMMLTVPILARWNGAGEQFRRVVAGIPEGAIMMSNNPPGLWVATRHPGIPLVTGDVTAVLAAADGYTVSYVLLDPNHAVGLAELYRTGRGERLRLIKTEGTWKVFEVLR